MRKQIFCSFLKFIVEKSGVEKNFQKSLCIPQLFLSDDAIAALICISNSGHPERNKRGSCWRQGVVKMPPVIFDVSR